MAICIDVFEDQGKNLDLSGSGDFVSFWKNLERFGIDSSRVHVVKGSSENVSSGYILQHVGPVRFFSVDGGHWKSIVQNDLFLAEQSLSNEGVIVLDDYCRTEWPDVTAGYTLWQERTGSDIVPFAAGSNKLFLCRRRYASIYRGALRTPFLNNFLGKTYKSQNAEVDSYRVEVVGQDETRVRSVFALVLKMFYPNAFVRLNEFRGRFRRPFK